MSFVIVQNVQVYDTYTYKSMYEALYTYRKYVYNMYISVSENILFTHEHI